MMRASDWTIRSGIHPSLKAGVLRQHFSSDQNHPTHAKRQAQSAEDKWCRGRSAQDSAVVFIFKTDADKVLVDVLLTPRAEC
jgi:hypothetical protein